MKLLAFFSLVLVVIFPARAGVLTTFDNGAGDALWTTAANWTLGSIPADTSDAVIGDAFTVVLNGVDPTFSVVAESLTLGNGSTLKFELGIIGGSPITLSNDFTVVASSVLEVDGTRL